MTIQEQRDALFHYFSSQETLSLQYRQDQLVELHDALLDYEDRLYAALLKDLNKSHEEAFYTEISIVMDEIRYALTHLHRWAKDRPVMGNLLTMPSRSYIHYEPLGVALIIAPWNYPVNLLLCPLVGAIASGCCAMLKPSPYTPTVSRVLTDMIRTHFNNNYISIVEGHRDVNTELLAQRWDLIFYTGSPEMGKVVLRAAAEHLTPCILELGGKSPCIVDADANLRMAARRIAWGKSLNNGQTCIAPDYLLVQQDVADAFMQELDMALRDITADYPMVHIVNERAMARLESYEQDKSLQWNEEIFGPLLPMRTFIQTEDAIHYVNSHEKPLALYYFGGELTAKQVVQSTSSGGVVINDTMLHIANPNLPFGGVGRSGMGRYHRHASFLAFSNAKSVLHAWNPIRLRLKEVPFYRAPFLEKFLRK